MIRVGIIGLGFMGRMHYKVYSQLAEAQVVMVADADPKRAAGDLSGGWGGNLGEGGTSQLPMEKIRGTTDWREIISSPDVDVVDVCLPTPFHVEPATVALAAGKNVLCEKPMARTLAQARQIAAAADGARGIFMPAMCMRFWAEWEWLKRAVVEGHYGKVKSATFHRLGVCPAGWFTDGKISGGALLDLHVHDVDFIYHLFGKPDGVFSRGYSKVTGEIDHVATQYLYGSGPLVYAEGSWGASPGYGFTMRYNVNFERATADFDFARKPATLMLSGDGKSEPVEHAKHDGYMGEISYFLECVKTGQKPQRVTADDAVTGLQIIEAERKSIETGTVVVV